MTRRRVTMLLGLLPLCAAACVAWHAQPLPSPVSPTPRSTGLFRAGAARVDITPPPGVGLGGSGIESRRSTGYRTHLYASALVLEDSSGERLALVVVDLAHVSANIHRLVADRLLPRFGIGADRLIISATHTHSGPSHFYGERVYNSNVSRVPGYDPRVAELLVSRITEAVDRAASALAPAEVAMGETTIAGVTFNRSVQAFCQNPGDEVVDICHPADTNRLVDTLRAVDPTLFMLRVDGLDTASRQTWPLASYSVFALHGTALPGLNTLLDGDSHFRIVQQLAAHAERVGGAGHRTSVHLLANGAEGDVAPDVSREQCDLPKLGPAAAVSMPRGPIDAIEFLEPPTDRVEHCLGHALDEIEREAAAIAAPAIALYDRLGGHWESSVPIRRAFATDSLPGRDGLCEVPVIGSSVAGGSEQLPTRVRGWSWLAWPFFRVALDEGGPAVHPVEGECQSPKRPLLGPIQSTFVVGKYGLPEVAQLTVVRIGPALLASMPAEVTTMAWRAMRDTMIAASAEAPRFTALIGLANGFLQYVTTAAEYRWQAFEGGSNLYGPGTAGFLARRLAELTRELPAPGQGPSPATAVGPITEYPGPPKAIMASGSTGPASYQPHQMTARCTDGRVVGQWLDLAPGRLFPRDSRWVVLERESSAGHWEPVAADGDGRLELQPVADRGKRGSVWRATWRMTAGAGRYRFVRLGDDGAPLQTSDPAVCAGRVAEGP